MGLGFYGSTGTDYIIIDIDINMYILLLFIVLF